MQGRIQEGAPPRAPLKLEKIWFFGVKSWFFTRNTPTIFAPPSAIGKNMICLRKIVIFHTKYPKQILSAPPLTWNPGSAPVHVLFFSGIVVSFFSYGIEFLMNHNILWFQSTSGRLDSEFVLILSGTWQVRKYKFRTRLKKHSFNTFPVVSYIVCRHIASFCIIIFVGVEHLRNSNYQCLTQPRLKPSIYRTRGEHTNHYATDAVIGHLKENDSYSWIIHLEFDWLRGV